MYLVFTLFQSRKSVVLMSIQTHFLPPSAYFNIDIHLIMYRPIIKLPAFMGLDEWNFEM
jgi:hypothetical protein